MNLWMSQGLQVDRGAWKPIRVGASRGTIRYWRASSSKGNFDGLGDKVMRLRHEHFEAGEAIVF